MPCFKLLNHLSGTTTAEHLFSDVEKTLIQCNLKWKLLRCTLTSDGKNMYGTEKDSVGQIHKCSEKNKVFQTYGYHLIYILHCLIYL